MSLFRAAALAATTVAVVQAQNPHFPVYCQSNGYCHVPALPDSCTKDNQCQTPWYQSYCQTGGTCHLEPPPKCTKDSDCKPAAVNVAVAAPAAPTSDVSLRVRFAPQHHLTTRFTHPTLGYEVVNTTYRSQALPLNPGQVVFTKPADTPMPMPNGTYAILGFKGEVVDDNHDSVPLSTVYDHHWIAMDRFHENIICNGGEGPDYVFGIGAESRRTPAQFPDGHGYIIYDADANQWGANIHLLHTVDLAGNNPHQAAKECNECYYAPGKGPECTPKNNGTFQCCGDRCYSGVCKCPTKPFTKMVPTNYYLQYTVTYTRAVESVKPLGVGVYTTPSCQLFYNVYRDDTNPVSVSRTTFTVAEDSEMVYAVGHLHTGGINISMYHNGEHVCTSIPSYGQTEGKAGDEKGYLVEMSTCYSMDSDTPSLKIKKGDKIDIEGVYWVGSEDPRIAYADGTHLNVMAYMYTAYVIDDPKAPSTPPVSASCASALIEKCGPVIGFQGQCDDCATENSAALEKAGCSRNGVERACAKKWYKDNSLN